MMRQIGIQTMSEIHTLYCLFTDRRGGGPSARGPVYRMCGHNE